jgi:hypothetical protein
MCGLLRILIPPTKLLKSHGNKKQLPLVFFVLLSPPLFHPHSLPGRAQKKTARAAQWRLGQQSLSFFV